MTEYNKQVRLTFFRNELLYDIRNYAFIEGDTKKTDDEHDKHMIFDIGEKGNVDRVTRVLDLAFAHCVELCYPYSKREFGSKIARDDEFEVTDEYVMTLRVPDTFSQTTVEYMEKLIHELLVYMVLCDWMSLTKPESYENWLNKINFLEDEIKSTLGARNGRVRRPLNPF